jgi:hypothetical protein
MTPEEKVAMYLTDTTTLYQDWYQIVIQNEDTTLQPIATIPSPKELEAMAKQWWQKFYNDNKIPLQTLFRKTPLSNREIACTWWYRIKGNPSEFKELAIALAVDLTLAPLIHPMHTVTVATLIVIGGFLDLVCDDCGKNG